MIFYFYTDLGKKENLSEELAGKVHAICSVVYK